MKVSYGFDLGLGTCYQFYWPTINEVSFYNHNDGIASDYIVCIWRIKLKPF